MQIVCNEHLSQTRFRIAVKIPQRVVKVKEDMVDLLFLNVWFRIFDSDVFYRQSTSWK